MKKKPKDSKIDNPNPILEMSKSVQMCATSKPREYMLELIDKIKYYHYYERRTNEEIAKIVGFHRNTISKYLKKIKANRVIVLSNKQILDDLTYVRDFNLQKLSELRQKLEDGDLKRNQINEIHAEIKVLYTIEGIWSQHIKDMQELSFIDKPKERHEIENTHYKFTVIKDERSKHKLVTKQKTKKSLATIKR